MSAEWLIQLSLFTAALNSNDIVSIIYEIYL